MKIIFNSLFVGFVVFIISYLVVGFCVSNWDMNTWVQEDRAIVSTAAFFAFLVTLSFNFIFDEDDE